MYKLLAGAVFILGFALAMGHLKAPQAPPAQPPALQHAPAQPAVYLATWNLEWLVRLADYPQLLANCDPNGQPNSNEWRFPCDNEHAPPPARTPADVAQLALIAQGLSGAVVALQEVDGPEAAAQLFPPSAWQLACFSQRKHPQNLGFALPRGIDYECGRELLGLDIDGKTRPGVVITLWPGTPQSLRLLNVHLKSGCFAGPLYKKGPCLALRSQVPKVEDWIDQQVSSGQAFVVLGDFNRRLEKDAQYPAGSDEAAPTSMFAAWHDQKPAGAALLRATALMADQPCSPLSPYTQGAIDNILVSASWAALFKRQEARRITYSAEQAKRYLLSDHCPLLLKLGNF